MTEKTRKNSWIHNTQHIYKEKFRLVLEKCKYELKKIQYFKRQGIVKLKMR